ncbi:polysaccharide pyruvyl transferase family protein [Lunatibacter salilacus]|uniref:polysaccharide pyruvyl transferase family protein n=1 Tax=Lunatibacter salilacus TaxID=2483804 RepID=UPI00131E3BD7|nr:polysaccharide pyruvyl transferase family protein [Lunatibacter salilacus]
MKIGIWGSYDKGNFGDDLMAYMISNYLIQHGHEPVVFCASAGLVEESEVRSIESLDEFVSSVDIVVIGGGGMLINNSPLRFLLKKVAFEFEMSFYRLYRSLRKHGKNIYPISIGGDGNLGLNNPFKKRLFSSPTCIGGTVRLASDLKVVDNKLFSCFSDIVLSTGRIFPKTDVVKSNTVVLNLKQKNGGSLIEYLSKSSLREKFNFVTFGSHLNSVEGVSEYELKAEFPHYQHENLKDSLGFLAQSCAVISSKLHVGVAGLAYGTPFISYKGPAKAAEFLNTVGLSDYVVSNVSSLGELLLRLDSYPIQNLKTPISESMQHYTELERNLRMS